jgi:hypothetical protein
MAAMKITKGLGTKLLAAWLIATGALSLLHITFPYRTTILDLVAIVAGVLLLLGR